MIIVSVNIVISCELIDRQSNYIGCLFSSSVSQAALDRSRDILVTASLDDHVVLGVYE